MEQATPFIISLTLKAPRQLVWDAFTKPEHLMHWFAPKGFAMPKCEINLRIGGTFHYCQMSPDGQPMWGKWIFTEITEPERLQVISSFSDEAGGITRHPLATSWPLQTLSTTTLTDLGDATIFTIEWVPFEATGDEIATFNSSFDGMNDGWNGTFEVFEAYLANIQ